MINRYSNHRIIRTSLSFKNYWDLVLTSFNGVGTLPDYNDTLALSFNVNNSTLTNDSVLLSVDNRDKLIPKEDILLCNHSYTGVDTCLFPNFGEGETLIPSGFDNIILNPICDTTVSIDQDYTGEYFNFTGGYLNGFYALEDTDYCMLPVRFEEGYTLSTWLWFDNDCEPPFFIDDCYERQRRPRETHDKCQPCVREPLGPNFTGGTNDFFYMGIKNENKFWNCTFDSDVMEILCNEEVDTTTGCVINPDDYVGFFNYVEYDYDDEDKPVLPPDINPFIYYNQDNLCDTGFTHQFDCLEKDYFCDLTDNGFSVGITDDCRVSFKFITKNDRNCDDITFSDNCVIFNTLEYEENDDGSIFGSTSDEFQAIFKEIYTRPNVLIPGTWNNIMVRYENSSKLDKDSNSFNSTKNHRKGTLTFYVNGINVLKVYDITEFIARSADERPWKQEGLGYNLNIGGSPIGLSRNRTIGNMIDEEDLLLPYETFYNTSFEGRISSLDLFTKPLNYNEILEEFNKNKFIYMDINKCNFKNLPDADIEECGRNVKIQLYDLDVANLNTYDLLNVLKRYVSSLDQVGCVVRNDVHQGHNGHDDHHDSLDPMSIACDNNLINTTLDIFVFISDDYSERYRRYILENMKLWYDNMVLCGYSGNIFIMNRRDNRFLLDFDVPFNGLTDAYYIDDLLNEIDVSIFNNSNNFEGNVVTPFIIQFYPESSVYYGVENLVDDHCFVNINRNVSNDLNDMFISDLSNANKSIRNGFSVHFPIHNNLDLSEYQHRVLLNALSLLSLNELPEKLSIETQIENGTHQEHLLDYSGLLNNEFYDKHILTNFETTNEISKLNDLFIIDGDKENNNNSKLINILNEIINNNIFI